ncbi:MAG: glycosyltransferase [Marinilabiliaceae bacterium]
MSTTEIVAAAVLCLAFVCQVFYWAYFMFRVRRRPRNLSCQLPDVSVIICARNEEDNLQRLIPALLAQKYASRKQIVIVDDCSTDNTPMVLAEAREKNPNEVYTTTIPGDSKFKHGKKLAISIGIKAAKYDHYVFIDADCVPATEHWLTTMMEAYGTEGKELVLGYGRYAKHPGLLNLMIRYETFWNAVQYFGFARALRPFMGVGRNLSYTRHLFDSSSKFRNNLNVLSGDDDLFVSEMGTSANSANVFIAEAHTVSEPKEDWLNYSAQKSRHLTTASLYPWSVKFWLGFEQTSRVLFWLSLVAVLLLTLVWPEVGTQQSSEIMWYIAGGALLVRTILIYSSMGMSAHNMGESRMWLLALPFDIMIPCMQAAAWITGYSTKSRNTWK